MQCYMRQHFGESSIASWRCYFDEHEKEVWVTKWMNPDVQTTLHTFLPKLIATILKALRELKENDQLHTGREIAVLVPALPIEHEHILKD